MVTHDRFVSIAELPGIVVGRFSVEADLQRELAAVDEYANNKLIPFTGVVESVLNTEPPMKDVAATFLMHACNVGRSDLVRVMLIEGVSLEARDSAEMTALMIAAENGHWSCVRELANAGADVTACSSDGRTALHYASGGNHVGFKSKAVNELLNAGANIEETSGCGNTALHESCQDHMHTVSLLLIRRNANVNAQDMFDCTPLHLAAAVNEEEDAPDTSVNDAAITAILVACGADVTLEDVWQQTALVRTRLPEHILSRYTLLEFAPQLQAAFYDDLSDATSAEHDDL